MGNREAWEIAAFIATTIGVPIAALGLFLIVIQTYFQRKQARRDTLFALYAQLDTHEARLARAFIYNARPEMLRLDSLNKEPEKLKIVDETLANLERMAYPIVRGYSPNNDAFNLYGQVLLSVSAKLWPYIEDQRKMRKAGGRHGLAYRRYLEMAIRKWACRYAIEIELKSFRLGNQSTCAVLKQLFPVKEDAEPIVPRDAAR